MGKEQRGSAQAKRRRARFRWLAAATVVLLGVIGLLLAWQARTAGRLATSGPALSSATAGPAVARRETRPTLDPARFVGKAALTHQIAREIPDTLDQLYCYCECDKHVGHKSLLSCYTDGHAAT